MSDANMFDAFQRLQRSMRLDSPGLDGDVVFMSGTEFRFVSELSGAPNEILIGETAEETERNLLAAADRVRGEQP